MILQRKVEHADNICIGSGTDAERLHSPRQAIDQAALNELQRFGFLASERSSEWLPEQPASKDVPPVGWERVRLERVKTEHALRDRGDRCDRGLKVPHHQGTIRLDEEDVGLGCNGVERMPSFEAEASQE